MNTNRTPDEQTAQAFADARKAMQKIAEQTAQAFADARKAMEKIADESVAWGALQGWKMRWEWRGNSLWLIDETTQPAEATEMFDIVTLPEAMRDLEVEGHG